MASTNYWSRNQRYDKPALKQIKLPLGISPWGRREESGNGGVWISMKPKKIIDQYTKGAGTISLEDPNVEYLFLAPLELNETLTHHWEAYESVASRLAQKARSLLKLKSEGTAFLNIDKNFLTEDAAAKDLAGSSEASTTENWLRKINMAVPGARIPKTKIDTPLYYSNSERRSLQFEFVLFNEMKKNDKNPEKHLIEPIQDIMKYSSPDLVNQGGIDINFPYMWEVKSYPQAFLKYTTCALTSVQPTWQSPYINGYPIACRLTLVFTDMSPLYKGAIENGSVVNVKSDSVKRQIAKDAVQKKEETRYAINKGTGQILSAKPVSNTPVFGGGR